MRKFYFLSTLTIVLTILLGNISYAQDYSNKGKNFWVSYPEHIDGTTSIMGLYLTSDVNTSGSINDNGTIIPFTVTANNITTVFMGTGSGFSGPNSYIHLGNLQDGIKTGAAVHVTSLLPIVVYAHIINSARSGATLVLPTNVWGKEYYAPSYANNGGSGTNQGYGEINVMASLPNTVVEITPKITTRNGARTAGVPYTITLANPGDVYQVQFPQNTDLSGTRIKSVPSGSGGCQPIAVISASTWSAINCGSGNGGDNFYQQLFPYASWGKEFFTTPLKKTASPSDVNTDIVRVYVKDATTVVTKTENGVLSTLAGLSAGGFYEYQTRYPTFVQADKPIEVFEYIKTQSCSSPATQSDPEMIALSSIDQTISDITVYSAINTAVPGGNSNVNVHYINVIMKTAGTSTFTINGVPPVNAFIPIPLTSYSYLKQNIPASNPVSRLKADSAFNAYAYGFGNVESYGYNAGTNVIDLERIELETQYGIETSPSVCTFAPFRFKVYFPDSTTATPPVAIRLDSLRWALTDPSIILPNIFPVLQVNPTIDSTNIRNGRMVNWYSLPGFYSFTAPGADTLVLTAYKTTNEDCGTNQVYEFPIQISSPPVGAFTWTSNGCATQPVQFTETTPQVPKPTYRFWWDFGDPASGPGNNSTLRNPTHLFSGPGTFTVRYAAVTTPGCLTDTVVHQITVDPPPVANFSFSSPDCAGGTISFTDNSTPGGSSSINMWNWNFGDPGSGPLNTSTLQNPTHLFANPGVYTVTLQVTTTTGCQSIVYSTQVTIHANPIADFTLPGVCLPTGFAQFNDLSTIAAGETITAWDWDFGDGSPHSNLQNPTHIYAGTGPYNVTLIVTSSNGCSNTITKVLNTVYAEPQAAFTYPPDICLGNAANFTDLSNAPGSTVTAWDWDFGDGSPHSNVQNPTHTYAAAGIYTVVLNVTSAAGCQTVNNFASHQVNVHTLPTATVTGAVTVCLNAPSPNITFTGANGTPPYTFFYTINGGPVLNVITVSGNSVNVAVPTGVAGNFVYALTSVQEGSGAACTQPQTGSVTVTVSPLPTATITGTTTVCQNAPSPNITFTGASGTAPYTFTYKINGGPNLVVTTVVGNSVTIAVPTTVPGTFVYTLVSVQEGGPQACNQAQTGTATVIVNNLPTATISGNTEVCLNAPSPNVTFTGAGTTPPYTFIYTINGGPNQTITTVSGNSVSVPVPTNVAGSFVYSLVNVQDGSPQTCGQPQTGSVTVVVNPLPVGDFTATVPTCETRSISFTDISVPNAGNIISWSWNFGDPGSGPQNTSTLQNPVHIFSAAGTYNVTLIVTTDKGCVSLTTTKQIVVNLRPMAGFMIPEVCLSDTYAQFTDTSKVSPPDFVQAWSWNFGDPGSGPLNFSSLQNPQHSYTATGAYNVELVAITNKGCRDTIVQVLFINGSFPNANFTVQNSAALCANDSVAIVEASTVFPGTITKVEIYWDNVGQPGVFDTDNFPVTGKVYKHLYPNFQAPLTRIFTIRYRAYSGGVCVNDKFTNITVNAAPLVQFPAIPNICLDAAPYQIPPPNNGGVPGTGVFSGPGVSPTGLFSPLIAGPGTHTIKYRYTSSAAGCVDSASQTIKVWIPPVADFSVSTPACEKQAVTFTDNSGSTEGSLTQWRWDFADGGPVVIRATGAAFTHTFATYGVYNVKLNVVTSNGCISTAKIITVTVKPIARPNFSYPAISCLPNANISFTNLSSIPDGTESSFTYLWNFGDPPSGPVNTSTAANPSHTYVGTGPYTVNLQVTSGAGCVHDTTIIVTGIHPQPIASFTTDVVDICVGGSVTFTSTSDPLDGSTTQWNWNLADGNIQTVPTFTYTYGAAGSYDVSLFIINSFNCKSNVFTKNISINPYPPVNAGPDKLMLEGGQVQLTPVLNANFNVTYSWTPPTYLNNPNIASPIASPPDDITYTLTETTDKGCVASDKVFIKVLKKPDIPNIFSPNGDGIHDVWEIKYLESYPGCTIDIVNRYGQLVYHSVGYANPWDGKIKGTDAPVGTYYYVVDPKNGRAKITGYVDIIR